MVSQGSVATDDSPYGARNSYLVRNGALGNVDSDPELEVVLVSNHWPYFPGMVAVADLTGEVRRRYWNPGHVYGALLRDVDGDGVEEIFVGCTNNDQKSRFGANTPAVFCLDGRSASGEARRDGGAGGVATSVGIPF